MPQRNATGATPPEEDAVHVMFVALGTPAQEAESVAALATANESANSELIITDTAAIIDDFIG